MPPVKSRRWLLPALVALVLAAASVAAAPFIQRARLAEDLARVATMYRVGYVPHIDLAAHTSFDWELVYVFTPYTTTDEIQAVLEVRWPGVRLTTVSENDGVNLLVFTRGGRVIRWVELSRAEADFLPIAERSPFSPENAIFFFPEEDSPLLQQLLTEN